MTHVNLTTFSSVMKDAYPLPGTRIKQYVVDARRETVWERETCPKFSVAEHDDNTGLSCRNVGRVPWTYLNHDCCETCCGQYEATESDPAVRAWLVEKAKRPPIEQDRSKFSDEVEPDFGPPGSHALFRAKR